MPSPLSYRSTATLRERTWGRFTPDWLPCGMLNVLPAHEALKSRASTSDTTNASAMEVVPLIFGRYRLYDRLKPSEVGQESITECTLLIIRPL